MGLLQKINNGQQFLKSAPPTKKETPAAAKEVKKESSVAKPLAKPVPAKKEVAKEAAKPQLKPVKANVAPPAKSRFPSEKAISKSREEPDKEKTSSKGPKKILKSSPAHRSSSHKARAIHHIQKKREYHGRETHPWRREVAEEYPEEAESISNGEEIKITPVKEIGKVPEEKFFLLKIGSFVAGLGGGARREKKRLEEQAKSMVAKKIEEKPTKKKKHRIRLIIMLVLIGVILEMLILSILNRLGIVDINPWQGPIVQSFIWLGSNLLMYGKAAANSLNLFVIGSLISIVLLLGVAVIFIRRVRKHKQEQKVAAGSAVPVPGAPKTPPTSAVAKTASTQAAKEASVATEAEEAEQETEEKATETPAEEKGEEPAIQQISGKVAEEPKAAESLSLVPKSAAYITAIDEVYNYIQTTGKISLNDVKKRFNISKDLAEEWARILESHDLINIEYPLFSSPILTKFKPSQEEEE